MLTIQALRDKKNALAQRANEIMAKATFDPATDGKECDELLNQIEGINDQIRQRERHNQLVVEDAVIETVANRADQRARDEGKPELALYAKFLRGGFEKLTAEECIQIRNTMSTTTGSEGGYTVATEIARQLVDALKAYGGMRAIATVLRQTNGHAMSYPTSDGTSEEGEIILENASASSLDPTFGSVGISVYKYSSKDIGVPFELLQDSEIDIEGFVRSRLATRLARVTNKHFTIGTGSGQPNGIITAASVGKLGANGQTVTVLYDDLIDLQHSVDYAYREGGNCAFSMNDSSVRVVRKIKDLEGRPIFAPGYDSGAGGSFPDRLLGDPLKVNNHIPVMAASAKSILYGNAKSYIIRDVMDVTLFRFADSAYTKKGQVGFLAWMRSGGNLTDVNAVKTYQNSAS